MGSLESVAHKKRRRMMVGQVILGSILAAATVGIAVAAPNAVQLLKYVDLDGVGSRDPRRRVSEAVSRLRRKGLVVWVKEGNAWHLRLTEKGKRHIEQARLEMTTIPQPKKWDGRWRFVMFDIPERQREMRRRVRALIVELGFYRFQDSVWVYPYDCEEIVALLKLEVGTGNKLLYIVADAVEHDAPLRKHFGLPESM